MPKIRRNPWHWIRVAALIAFSVWLGIRLDENDTWINWRYDIHRYLQISDHNRIDVERTALVLIGDEEYWRGELARRVPLKRTYLAKLLRALDTANPAIIVLDFDLRSPMPDGSILDFPDYAEETAELLQTIREISHRRKIVLPSNLGEDAEGHLVRDAAIYDGFDFQGGRVKTGYIEMPYDLRQVPLPLKIRGGGAEEDSLAAAAVRFESPDALRRAMAGGHELPYGSFAGVDDFRTIPAGGLLNDPRRFRDELEHKIVLVGANWSRLAYRNGPQVDEFHTPIGTAGLVFMHANYIEALLDGRTYVPLPEVMAIAIEVLFSLAIAVLFAFKMGLPKKLLSFLATCLVVLFLTYVFWQNFGLFFDFLIPLILLALHAAADQINDWRLEAHKPSRPRMRRMLPMISFGSKPTGS